MLRVGITADWREIDGKMRMILNREYHEWLHRAGMLAVALPSLPGTEAEALRGVHAIVLSGGRDIQPRLFGAEPDPRYEETYSHEDRTAFEFALVWRAAKKKIPLLGICLGCQTINVALGGDIIRHMSDPHWRHRRQFEPEPHPVHRLRVREGSLMASLYDSGQIRVLSSHHQSIGRPAEGFVATAWGPDNIIEAIENPSLPNILGIQWHPESTPRSRFSRAIASWLREQAEHHRSESN